MEPVFFRYRILVALMIFMSGSVLLSGCAWNTLLPPTTKPEKPRLSLVDVQLLKKGKSSFWQPRLRVRLKVENPNNIEIPIGGLQFRIELQGMTLANGAVTDFFTIPPLGDTEVDVEVSTELLKALQQLSVVLRKGEAKVTYRITGHIDVEIPLVGTVPFDKSGELSKPLKWDD
ncbi:MAG: LEA type 2 family protein [Magnetococcus sp. YQC-5]